MSYHYLNRDHESTIPSNGYQADLQDDQVSLVSISPSRDRFPSDQNSFGSILQDSFYPSNQPSLNNTSVGEYEDIPISRDAGPAPSHALDSDLGNLKERRRSTISRKPIALRSKQETTNSDIELLPLPDECQHLQESHADSSPKEWKPYMLRKGPATLLVAACWLLAAILEVFRSVGTKRQGFSTENKNFVDFIRYFPTIVVICLGFAWKSLVWDLKVITPYSEMSRRPTSADKSIWLNYIDSVEFMSVWNSARNRHWAMFLGLATGLLCGILTPLANALTFISLNFPLHQDVETNLVSQFSFDNALSDFNGTLTMPWDYRGGRPYAAIASSRMDNGKNSPWTVDGYAFESVDLAPWKLKIATVSIKVQAFNADFDCKKIGYTFNSTGYYPYIRANEEDLVAAGCILKGPLDQSIGSDIEHSSLGWLNVTDCSGNGSDVRMLATIVHGKLEKRKIVEPTITGLLCTPVYSLREAQVYVDGSSGDVLEYSLYNTNPKILDPVASVPVVVVYLNNPVDENSQYANAGPRLGSWNFKRPQATFKNITIYASIYKNRDVFFDNLLTGNRTGSDYTKDPDLLRKEVAGYGSIVLAQVINSLARKTEAVPITGSVVLFERRLLVRISVLRAMQAILIFMGISSGLCCSFMRPKSRLSEDPGNIAAVAILMSRSSHNIDRQEATSSEKEKGWMLTQSHGSGSALEFEEILTSKARENRSLDQEIGPAEGSKPTGFKPLAFRWAARVLLIFFVSSTIIVLAVLLHFSVVTGGFVVRTSTASSAWSIVPSVILVLLGYCLSSVHGVLESFTPYLTLRKKSGSSTLQRETHASVFYMPVKAILRFGSIVLATSSLIALIFPVVKVLAAGLYVPETSFKSGPLSVLIDTSLTDNFEDMYAWFSDNVPMGVNEDLVREQKMMVKRASQAAEWTNIPDFGYPHRHGAMKNLVFTGFSNISIPETGTGIQNDRIAVNMPSISTKVSCVPLGEENFKIEVQDNRGDFVFRAVCATKLCNETLGNGSYSSWTKSYSSGSSLTKLNRFQGGAIPVGHVALKTIPLLDTPYNLWLGDFKSISEPFVNQTFIPGKPTPLVPGMFNMSSMPIMIAVSCNKEFWEVEVDVELSRASKSGLHGTIILPWAVTKFNESTINYKRQYPKATPLWAYPQHTVWNQYNQDADSVLKSETLWPSISKATNIFELIAAYQEFQVGNLTGLLDPVQLGKAVENSYISYLVEILTEMRPYTSVNATAPRIVAGTLYTPLTRMKQDKRTTIALCVLLSLMLVGLLYVFIKFPRESLMANPPTSIAAQMSLLAGSKLVQKLREENVISVKGTELFRKKFRLGWWPVNGESGWRWGIDVVEDTGEIRRDEFNERVVR